VGDREPSYEKAVGNVSGIPAADMAPNFLVDRFVAVDPPFPVVIGGGTQRMQEMLMKCPTLYRVTKSEGTDASVFLLKLALDGFILFVVANAHNYPLAPARAGAVSSMCG
jgi:hypothetical protein